MKHFLLKTWLTMLCLLVGVGSAWAETIEINTTNSGVTGSYADKTFKVNDVTFGFTQWMKSTNIQAKKSTTNSCYNVDAIPGNIKKITVVQTGTARAITMYGGTSSKPTTQITSPTTGETMVFNFTGKNYTYFSMTTPGNAVYINTITIEYETNTTNYTVTVAKNIANGTVTASPTSAIEGTEITLTATPDAGYEFGSWNVTDASSKAIAVTNNKFTMPAADVNVSATFSSNVRPANEIFYESFNQNNEIGGNDGTWTGISDMPNLTPDNTGWTFDRGYGASRCARFGIKSGGGYASSPQLNYTGDAIMTFKAAAWSNDGTTLNISVSEGGTADVKSVEMLNAEWSTYEVRLSGLTEASKVKFSVPEGNQHRFFLDEISIVSVATKTLSSISVKTAPTKLRYDEGEQFNPAGLVIIADYGVDGTTDVAYEGNENAFSFAPSLTTALTTSTSKIVITYGGKTVEQTITVNVIPAFSITIDEVANGTISADVNSAKAGATITLSATPSDGYEFGEWTVIDNGLNEIAVTNNQFTMPASDVLVSATFTEVQGGDDEPAGEYVLTSVDQISESDEVVIVFTNSTASYAMSNDKGTSNPPSAVEVTVANNSISSPAANLLWNVAYSDGTFVIYPKGETTKWLYCTNTNNGVKVGAGDAKNFQIKDNYLYEEGTTEARYLGVYNNSDVRCYTSINSNISGQTLAFYVKKAAPKVLASIALSGTYQTNFIQRQTFNHNGVVVTATYEDGTNKVVTDKATFSTPDMTIAGTQTITVSYTESAATKTATYDITVAAEELTSIELGGNYTKNFEQNATFNHDGLTVTAHYNSGRTADVTADATFSEPNMATLGEQTITVTYDGKEATYTIKIAGYYTVTIDNTNDTHGTISVWNGDLELASGAKVLDGTVLTIKYEVITEFYRFKNWQYKDNSVSKYTSKWDYFAYTIEGSDVSFRINFEEIPLYTITYYVNGVPTTEEVREGAALNFPANPTMAGKVFRGWIDKVKVDDSSVKPTFVTATKAQGNATFFAVFATETTTEGETGSDVWEKVPHDFNAANVSKTDETKYADWVADGDQYLIVYEASSTQGYVFNGTGDDKDYKTVTITDGKIADDASFVYITMSGVNSNHVGFTVHGSANDGLMMNDKQGSNGMKFYNFNDLTTISDRAYVNNDISTNNYSSYDGPYSGQWSVKGSNGYLRFYTSSGSNYFRYYTTETTGNPVEFYVKKAATGTTTEYSDFTTNMDVIERNEVNGKYFTICYPYAVHPKAYPGAKAYNIVGKTLSGDRIATLELEEVDADTPLEAGMPYFMVGDQTNFMGYHSLDNSVDEARNHNGLYGVFVDYAFKDDPNYELNEYYVIYSNAVKAGSVNSGVKANRAFIKKSEVPDYVAPTESAARFVIELEEGTLTELDEVELKPIETSIYNLQGQRINRAEKGVYIVNGRKVIR